MSHLITIPPEKLCTSHKSDGTPCKAARVNGHDRCTFHLPRKRTDDIVDPSLTLSALASLDLSLPEGISAFRVGIMQHLLALSVEPHVAKVALDVAETVHRNAKRKDDGKSSVERITAAVMSKPPPPVDE